MVGVKSSSPTLVFNILVNLVVSLFFLSLAKLNLVSTSLNGFEKSYKVNFDGFSFGLIIKFLIILAHNLSRSSLSV